MDNNQKYDLITRRLQEVLGEDILRDALKKSEETGKPLRLYWGTAPTGRRESGPAKNQQHRNAQRCFFLTVSSTLGLLCASFEARYVLCLCTKSSSLAERNLHNKADFLKAGVHVVILLADVHAFLDNLKAPIELVAHRANYYQRIITAALKAIGVPTDRLEFVLGSTYQYEPKYNLDKYKLCAITSEHDARRAGAEVVKQAESPPLSGLLYPLLQALDEEYLNVSVQFGGVDQVRFPTLHLSKHSV